RSHDFSRQLTVSSLRRRPTAIERRSTSGASFLQPVRDFPMVDPRFRLIAVRRSRPETRATMTGPLLLVSTALTLLCSLMATEVAAQAITVAPAGPVIFVGQTQQFTATGIDTATAIEAGIFHQCALLQDTTVRCWGQNDYGQLGDGTLTPTFVPNRTPVQVFGITTAVVVSAGGFHTCALLADSTIRCWGQNNYGQLGDGTTTNAVSPITTPASP